MKWFDDWKNFVRLNKIVWVDNEWMDWERFNATVNYCPMCGRKLDEEEN